jgi:hypothetical protein
MAIIDGLLQVATGLYESTIIIIIPKLQRYHHESSVFDLHFYSHSDFATYYLIYYNKIMAKRVKEVGSGSKRRGKKYISDVAADKVNADVAELCG